MDILAQAHLIFRQTWLGVPEVRNTPAAENPGAPSLHEPDEPARNDGAEVDTCVTAILIDAAVGFD